LVDHDEEDWGLGSDFKLFQGLEGGELLGGDDLKLHGCDCGDVVVVLVVGVVVTVGESENEGGKPLLLSIFQSILCSSNIRDGYVKASKEIICYVSVEGRWC
jgi:hypothetical protein